MALTRGLEWLSPDISEAREPVVLLISIASFMIVVRAVATDARHMQNLSITRWASVFESLAFVATAVLLLVNLVGILLPTLRTPLTLAWVSIAIVAACELAGLYLAVIKSREMRKNWTTAMS
ncbi:MAG: hypothetical protein KF691_07550 [Phycisphaeraceae bacterium]|nr:hypothetical protein [Phycisphaeraceae bacterium]